MLSKSQILASENPFYNLKSLLQTFQQLPKMLTPTATAVNSLLDSAAREISTLEGDQKKKAQELLYILIFKLGDVQNRQHVLFGKDSKIDGGGDSLRKAFRYALNWLVKTNEDQFYKFLPLIPEYTNFENTFFHQIRTDRYKGKIEEIEKIPVDYDKVASYLATIIKDASVSKFQKALVAKFLPKVPSSKRYKKDKSGKSIPRPKQKATLEKDQSMMKLIIALSKEMQWTTEVINPEGGGKSYTRFHGYEKFRSEHLQLTESYLFSTHKIKEFDSTQFTSWLDSLPSGARFRVQCRVCEKTPGNGVLKPKDKWKNNGGTNLGQLYMDWLKGKEAALKKLLSLSDDDKKNMDKKDFATLQKLAKVNTGADSLFDVVGEFMANKQANTAMADLKAHQILSKVKGEVPVMLGLDVSNSMLQNKITINGHSYNIRELGVLAIAVFLSKNPDPDLADMFMMFTSDAKIVVGGKNDVATRKNKFMTKVTTTVDAPLYDKTKTFTANYSILKGIIDANAKPQSTNLTCLSQELHRWVNEEEATKAMKIEMIQQYPVWLFISDGDINNAGNATASMAQFQADLRNWFQTDPVIVIWDVKPFTLSQESSKFAGLPNVMYFGGFNYETLTSIFVNINDMDIVDIYLPLKALYESNRYAPVKALVI